MAEYQQVEFTVPANGRIYTAPIQYSVTGHTSYRFRWTIQQYTSHTLQLQVHNTPHPPPAETIQWSQNMNLPTLQYTSANFAIVAGVESVFYWVIAGSPDVVGSTVRCVIELAWDGESWPAYGPCQYGTMNNPEAAIYTTVTTALVDIVTVILGGGPLMILAFDALLGAPLFAYNCDQLPPTAPTFNDSDFLGETGIITPGSWWKLMDLFRVGVWHFYCQCAPATGGGPDPVPPALPDPGPPLTDPGPSPKLPCSDADMCQVLNIIVRQINSISLNIQYNRQTNNYFPSPSQAFNYQLGAPHPGIYGSGYLSIGGLVGLKVDISSRPEGTLELQGNPPYLWNMGWMSVDDDDGMLEEKRITRDSFVWLPTHMAQANAFGWNLNPEVVITVWELLPAPA